MGLTPGAGQRPGILPCRNRGDRAMKRLSETTQALVTVLAAALAAQFCMTPATAQGLHLGWCIGVGNPHKSANCGNGGGSGGQPGPGGTGLPPVTTELPASQTLQPTGSGVTVAPVLAPYAIPTPTPYQVPTPVPYQQPVAEPHLVPQVGPQKPYQVPTAIPYQQPVAVPHQVPQVGPPKPYQVPAPVPYQQPVAVPHTRCRRSAPRSRIKCRRLFPTSGPS